MELELQVPMELPLWRRPYIPLWCTEEDSDPPPPTDPDPDPEVPPDEGSTTGGGSGGIISVSTGSRTMLSISQAGHTVQYDYHASYSGNTGNYIVNYGTRLYQNGVFFRVSGSGSGTKTSKAWTSYTNDDPANKAVVADNNQYSWRGQCYQYVVNKTKRGTTLYFKSHAITATSSAPVASGVTASAAYIDCNFYPNTLHSTATVQLQYKKTVDSVWTNLGDDADTQGYSQVGIGRALTGLTASTAYDVRLSMTRNTVNETSLISATGGFNTLAGEPTVVTDAASSLHEDGATLNATLDINSGTTVTGYWKWGVQNPPTDTTTSSQALTADGAFSLAITGALAATTYYAQAYIAFATPTGTPNNGAVVSFATPNSPSAEAADQQHVQKYEFDRKYAVATTLYFTMMPTNSHDVFLTTASPCAAGDVLLFIDGAYSAATTNLPVLVSAGKALYSLTLTAAEMTGNLMQVQIHDVAGGIFRDLNLNIYTHRAISSIDIDAATGTKANTSAVKLTGYGSGHGLELIPGATGVGVEGLAKKMFQVTGTIAASSDSRHVTLGSEGTALADHYNGAIILFYTGAGAGQARVIENYYGNILTDAQTEADYDNSPATEGTFSGGTAHDVGDILTLSDGSTVEVEAETGNVVTEFTVTSTTSTGALTAVALTQASTDGSGAAFTLTPEADNLTASKIVRLQKVLNNYTADPVGATTKYIIFAGDDSWEANPGAELGTVPTFLNGYGALLQYVFERVIYERTETATVHQMLLVADDTTAWAQYGVDNDGALETKSRTEDV